MTLNVTTLTRERYGTPTSRFVPDVTLVVLTV